MFTPTINIQTSVWYTAKALMNPWFVLVYDSDFNYESESSKMILILGEVQVTSTLCNSV